MEDCLVSNLFRNTVHDRDEWQVWVQPPECYVSDGFHRFSFGIKVQQDLLACTTCAFDITPVRTVSFLLMYKHVQNLTKTRWFFLLNNGNACQSTCNFMMQHF